MKNFTWQVTLGIILVFLSVLFYFLHYIIFHDVNNILYLLLSSIAFVPIEVLFVTLFLHRLLNEREKHNMLKKLNMVIGTFYSEVGTSLIRLLTAADRDIVAIRNDLLIDSSWNDKKINEISVKVRKFDFHAEIEPIELEELRDFLIAKRNFLLRLLENPNLLEHESFTELLWSVFHLSEELAAREDIKTAGLADLKHITADIQRVYKYLTLEWLAYMNHLMNNYPFLFSFAVRTNPFNPEARVEIP